MNDEILDLVRGSAAALHLDKPLDAIEARARTLRRRRTLTGVAGGSVVAGLVLTVALSVLGGQTAPAVVAAPGHTAVAQPGESLRPVGFTIAVAADDTVTVTFQQVMLDPTVLEKALAEAGVPAKVWLNSVCVGANGVVPAPQDWVIQAVRFNRNGPDGQPTLTVRKTQVPPGATLGLGVWPYQGQFRLFDVVVPTGGQLSCTSLPPTAR